MLHRIILILSIFLSFNLLAQPSINSLYLSELQQKALDLKLHEDTFWRALLHYRSDAFSNSGYSSYVDDREFFYAIDGDENAQSELEKTLEAFFFSSDKGNNHARCRSGLRYQWLSEKLSIREDKLPTVVCSDYAQWRKEVNAHSVSLVFPASTLNSPSSMFGHTLLRFDPKDIELGSDWLSYALNFGANVDANDNSIFFAYRGIAGGYPGVYNMMRYFEKIKEYSRMENRDMWEYKLNFSPEEIDVMLAHVWELKDINFDYFFLDENCSFRLLELMELVRPDVQLTNKFSYAVIPTDTVRVVVDAGLVEDIRYRPSEVSKLRTRIDSLSESNQQLARALADNIEVMQDIEFQNLSADQQGQVVQLAFSYLRYQQRKIQRSKEMAKRSHQLLVALNKLPSKQLEIQEPASPETGHDTAMVSLGVGDRHGDFFQQLNFRVNYHDLLDNEQGYLRGAQIMFSNVELRHYEEQGIKLHKYELLDINSMSNRNRFLTPWSWKVNMGYQRVFSDIEDEGVFHLNGGIGQSYALTEDSSIYVLATARAEHNKNFEYFVEPALGGELGIISNLEFGANKLHIQGYKFTNGEYRMKTSFEQNINLSVNHALRISLGYERHNRDDFGEVIGSYRFYF
jgi:hypothetical protein